jgi:hypothetical protein
MMFFYAEYQLAARDRHAVSDRIFFLPAHDLFLLSLKSVFTVVERIVMLRYPPIQGKECS